MITKIEALDGYRGTFHFITSRRKVEPDGTVTLYPGMTVEWEIDENGDCVYDIVKAAEAHVESLVNQGLLPYDDNVMKGQRKRIIELFQKALPRWEDFQEGKVRQYVDWEQKKKNQAQKLLEEANPEILDMALEMRSEAGQAQKPQEQITPDPNPII